jgi:hypothetical protein
MATLSFIWSSCPAANSASDRQTGRPTTDAQNDRTPVLAAAHFCTKAPSGKQPAEREIIVHHRDPRAAAWRLGIPPIFLTRLNDRTKQLSSQEPFYKLSKRIIDTVVRFYFDVDSRKTQDVPDRYVNNAKCHLFTLKGSWWNTFFKIFYLARLSRRRQLMGFLKTLLTMKQLSITI